MKLLSLVLIVLASSAQAERIRVEGDGYLRVVKDGRLAFCKEGELQIVDGRLAVDGAQVLPAIGVQGLLTQVTVELDGTVMVGASTAGRLVLALFAEHQPSGTGIFTSSLRAEVGNPGEGTNGVVRYGVKTVAAPSAVSSGSALRIDKSTLGSGLSITIKPSAAVSADYVVVGDVVDMSGNVVTAEQIGKIELARSPALARTTQITRDEILRKIKAAGYRTENFVIKGLGPVQVERAAQTINHEQFVATAIEAAQAALPSGTKLTPGAPQGEFVVPQGRIELTAGNVVARGSEVAVTVGITVSGKYFNSRTLKLRMEVAPIGVRAKDKVRVLFRKNDLLIEAQGIVRKDAAVGGLVEVVVGATKEQETVHLGKVTSPGVIEVQL